MSGPQGGRGSGRRRPDWLVIARREFIERVRSPWFVVVTLLGPVLMLAGIVVPALLAGRDTDVHMQIVDHTHKLGPAIVDRLRWAGWKVEEVPDTTPEAELLDRIKHQRINGFLTVPADALEHDVALVYRGDNATNQGLLATLYLYVPPVVQEARGHVLGLRDDQIEQLTKRVAIDPRHTTGDSEGSSGGATFLLGYALMFILYIAIVLYAVTVMRSVVQEKANRIVEVMVAAAKPRALMLGKILGVGGLGLLQLSVWIAMSVVSIKYRMQILGVFGASGGFTLPALTLAQGGVALGYFVLGYFFYAAIYAAVGAMVSSEQEAQQVQTPVMMLLMLSALCVSVVTSDPRGGAAQVLTMIPFSSPMLMPMRFLLGGATLGQLLVSMAILGASTLVVALVAARIYRVGILMYGKRPSLRELVRWLRH